MKVREKTMYRCRVTYDEWKCIIEKSRIGKVVNTEEFSGYIGLLNIQKVDKPQIWKYSGENLVVCDNHYQWMTILPENEYYCMTVMMNEKAEFQVCYIDMIAGQGWDKDDVPYFYDLYLDLVVYPDGTIIEDDMDELQEAVEKGDISKQEFDLALNTAEKLKNGLLSDRVAFGNFIKTMYDMVRA